MKFTVNNSHNRLQGWHRTWGLHSNIPECCVEAWVTLGPDNMPEMPSRSGWGYRPCQDCFSRGICTKVQIHHCTIKCMPFLESLNFSKKDIVILIAGNIRKENLKKNRVMLGRLSPQRNGSGNENLVSHKHGWRVTHTVRQRLN